MNKHRYSPLAILFLSACTAHQGHVGAVLSDGACEVGRVVGPSITHGWGQVAAPLVTAAACWLADWQHRKLERLRELEQLSPEQLELEQPTPRELEQLDAAAVRLAEARAVMLAAPCERAAVVLASALERCLMLDQQARLEND